MKLIANRINGIHLRDLLPALSAEVQVDSVLAAVAYGSSASDITQDLIGHCVANKLRLDLWMRYDHTVPVSVELLKRLLNHQKDNVFTRFVPDRFHPKVIWWKGYGTYIGSANHTDNGWLTNIEAGVFLTEDELLANGMDSQLEDFFEYLRELDVTIPISADYIAEMERLNALNRSVYADAFKARKHPEWEGPSFVEKKPAFDRRKETFKREWLSTLGILQSIQQQLADYRPNWVGAEVPAAWQVDQFLHAYYYNHVGDSLHKPYEDYHRLNQGNPQVALETELKWWKSLSEAPSREDYALYESAPTVRALLAQDKVQELTCDEFATLCRNTHATMDHIIKVPLAELGRPELKTLDREARVGLFAPLILRQRNRKGWDVRQLLYYVLYGGPNDEIWQRLYHAGRDSDYSIARYGLNSLAEVVGWARPELVPPRNGRTSKALRALGFDVKVY
ncbi:TPA: phospholipase D family protein [Pseudomonas aeruginosa]|uniref:phospholipase D family protein n=1 Tax=Pseudomonas aeruginosa TaxID=287 RepID=UPI00159CD287|nr:phospholipase D family protein [Pseudomonas aeruginosa]MBH3668816.1 phospholipase D family protein [Pseudomonas aeruginosa]QKZ74098.1 phosphatidylserine/phosphatidylglycerophosphate/cardiolipin synthase family protein [Pseudomonas aeruginosa]HBP1919007.1 phosphatidylserine/phosphatidylglycerophosphate/cardiolipin synthase family protein [Pseudomonas aeruginosa]HBP1974977.1 phosphatidylserine/phosphatidylglycerophosphate/cardiolipin synthase family protein [Pseudomonas aeruginosa]HBP1987729.